MQHHPEYVSLVWGAIKFCFIGISPVLAASNIVHSANTNVEVLNQEVLVAKISKALAQIADALPRAAMKLVLYPTGTMKEAVATIYAHIVKFLMR